MNFIKKEKEKLLLNREKSSFTSAVDRYRKKRKKEMITIASILIVILSFFIFVNSPYLKLKHIVVNGYTQLSQEEILEAANINNNVKTWQVKEKEVEDHLKNKYNIISEISVKTAYLDKIFIEIKEYKIIAKEKDNDGKYQNILETGHIYNGNVNNLYSVPILDNFTDNAEAKNNVLRNLKALKEEILIHISDISLDNNNKEQALIYMKDGQRVKVNIVNFSNKLNHYFQIEKHISDKYATVLNLVNGAYLETEKTIKEKESKIKAIIDDNNNSITQKTLEENQKEDIEKETKDTSGENNKIEETSKKDSNQKTSNNT